MAGYGMRTKLNGNLEEVKAKVVEALKPRVLGF
jgi:hypothetical protein